MPAGVNSTEGSQVGTSTSLGQRLWPLVSKNARYFSRSSSVFMERNRRIKRRETDRPSPNGWAGNPGKTPNIPHRLLWRQSSQCPICLTVLRYTVYNGSVQMAVVHLAIFHERDSDLVIL